MTDDSQQEVDNTSVNEVTRYRTGIATLLAIQVNDADKIEQKLGVVVGDDVSELSVAEDMPFGPCRVHCALMLHKARLHMVAMLSANESSNLHSLAVQMRTVLECAGQVKHVVHNLLVEPENVKDVMRYWENDYFETFVRRMTGETNKARYKQLYDQISDIHKTLGGTPPAKLRRLRQIEKVASLEGGEDWNRHLSIYFCRGDGDLSGETWRGGVVSSNAPSDEFALAGHMDYSVEQAAVMNSYAALLIPSTKPSGERMDSILNRLEKIRYEAKTLRDDALAAIDQIKGQKSNA